MPSVKELARLVIDQNWPLGDLAFERAWDDLRDHPLIIATGPSNQPALAAASTTKDKAIIATAFFTFVLEQITDETTLQEILPLLDKIALVLGDKGIFIRIKKTLARAYAPDTQIQPIRHRVFTDEQPDGEHINHEETKKYRQRRAKYDIFIEHELTLPAKACGHVYLNGAPLQSELDATRYRILHHLLIRKHRTAERTLEAIIELCWPDGTARARTIRSYRDKTERADQTKEERAIIANLSTLLQQKINVAVITKRTAFYSLVPWPTYCVLEET